MAPALGAPAEPSGAAASPFLASASSGSRREDLLRGPEGAKNRLAGCLRIEDEALCPHCGGCPGLLFFRGCGLYQRSHEGRCGRRREMQRVAWAQRATASANLASHQLRRLAQKLPRELDARECELNAVTWSLLLVPWIWLAAEEAGEGTTHGFIDRLVALFSESQVRLDLCGLDGVEVLRGAWRETVRGFELMGITSAKALAAAISSQWPELRKWTSHQRPHFDAVPREPPPRLEPWNFEKCSATYIEAFVQEWVLESIEEVLNWHLPESSQHIMMMPRVFAALLDALAEPAFTSEVSTAEPSQLASVEPGNLASLETAC